MSIKNLFLNSYWIKIIDKGLEAALGFEPRIPDLQSAALVHLAMPPYRIG